MKNKGAKKKDGGDTSAKSAAHVLECRRQCWTSAKNHEAYTMAERSPDLGERKRGCEVAKAKTGA